MSGIAPDSPRARRRLKPWLAWGLGCLLILLLAGGAFVYWFVDRIARAFAP